MGRTRFHWATPLKYQNAIFNHSLIEQRVGFYSVFEGT